MSDRITSNNWRNSQVKLLTVDNTVRSITLTPGRYFLMADAAQTVRFGVRWATNSAGALQAGEVAPTLPLPTVGTPGAGSAWGAGAPAVGEADLPADTTASSHRQIDVPEGKFLNLYLIAPAGGTPKLVGPVHWELVNNSSEGR